MILLFLLSLLFTQRCGAPLAIRAASTVRRKNTRAVLHLLCSEMEIGTEFTKKLNELKNEDGKPLYEAEQGRWQRDQTVPRFKGKVDVRIELLDLSGRKTRKQREADYRGQRKVG